jgi:hypothetical protein
MKRDAGGCSFFCLWFEVEGGFMAHSSWFIVHGLWFMVGRDEGKSIIDCLVQEEESLRLGS